MVFIYCKGVRHNGKKSGDGGSSTNYQMVIANFVVVAANVREKGKKMFMVVTPTWGLIGKKGF